jgi:hypothetical protein
MFAQGESLCHKHHSCPNYRAWAVGFPKRSARCAYLLHGGCCLLKVPKYPPLTQAQLNKIDPGGRRFQATEEWEQREGHPRYGFHY